MHAVWCTLKADCENLWLAYTVARCSGRYLCISWVDELLDSLLISVNAGIIKLLMQCSVKLDDLRLKKSS